MVLWRARRDRTKLLAELSKDDANIWTQFPGMFRRKFRLHSFVTQCQRGGTFELEKSEKSFPSSSPVGERISNFLHWSRDAKSDGINKTGFLIAYRLRSSRDGFCPVIANLCEILRNNRTRLTTMTSLCKRRVHMQRKVLVTVKHILDDHQPFKGYFLSEEGEEVFSGYLCKYLF